MSSLRGVKLVRQQLHAGALEVVVEVQIGGDRQGAAHAVTPLVVALPAWLAARAGVACRACVARQFIDGLAAQLERLRHIGEVFRVAGEQQTTRFHQRLEARQHLRLRRLVEIDHHVAAEDRVELRAQLVIAVGQIQLFEAHHRAHFRAHLDHAGVRAGALQEEALEPLGRQMLHLVELVHAGFGFRQHLRVDVGGEHGGLTRTAVAERFDQRHRDRIRFLTGRGRRAPHRNRLRAARHELGQDRKVMGFAEERGQVGGQRIGERFPLGRIVFRFEQIEVLLEGLEATGTQAARQTAVRHIALVIRQGNARAAMNQIANASEIRRREFEIPSLLAGSSRFRPGGARRLRRLLFARCHYESPCLQYEPSRFSPTELLLAKGVVFAGSRPPASSANTRSARDTPCKRASMIRPSWSEMPNDRMSLCHFLERFPVRVRSCRRGACYGRTCCGVGCGAGRLRFESRFDARGVGIVGGRSRRCRLCCACRTCCLACCRMRCCMCGCLRRGLCGLHVLAGALAAVRTCRRLRTRCSYAAVATLRVWPPATFQPFTTACS